MGCSGLALMGTCELPSRLASKVLQTPKCHTQPSVIHPENSNDGSFFSRNRRCSVFSSSLLPPQDPSHTQSLKGCSPYAWSFSNFNMNSSRVDDITALFVYVECNECEARFYIVHYACNSDGSLMVCLCVGYKFDATVDT